MLRRMWLTGIVSLLAFTPLAFALDRYVTSSADFTAQVAAMQDGDTVWVPAGMRIEAPIDWRGKLCTNRGCAIRGQGGPATITGMRPETDWQPAGEGRYSRFMQAAIDPMPENNVDGMWAPDNFTPVMLAQRNVNGKPWEALGFVGENNFAPGDGQYSYFPASHMVIANPYGTAPISDVHVPFLWRLVELLNARGYFTLDNLVLQGTRANIIHNGGLRLERMTLTNVELHAFPRFAVKLHTRSLWIDGGLFQLGARGLAICPRGSSLDQNGAYGMRIFGIDGECRIANVTVRDMAAHNRDCPGCGVPWNRAGVRDGATGQWVLNGAHTLCPAYAEAIDIKQSTGCTVEHFILQRGPVQGAINVDSSDHVVIQDGYIEDWTTGVDLMVQTPVSGHTASFENTVQRVEIQNAITGIDFDGSDSIPAGTNRGYQGWNTFVNVARPFGSGLPSDVVTLSGPPEPTTTSTTRPPTTTSTIATTTSTLFPITTTSTRPTTTSLPSTTSTSQPPPTTTSSTLPCGNVPGATCSEPLHPCCPGLVCSATSGTCVTPTTLPPDPGQDLGQRCGKNRPCKMKTTLPDGTVVVLECRKRYAWSRHKVCLPAQ